MNRMNLKNFVYKYIILVHNNDALKYIRSSLLNQKEHYYYVNRSINHFDYFNLLSIEEHTNILFIECNNQYEAIKGYAGIGYFDFEREHLRYIINKSIEIHEPELELLNSLEINIANQFSIHNLVINVTKKIKPYNDNRIVGKSKEIRERLISLEVELYKQLPLAFNTYYELRQKHYYEQPITKGSLMGFHSIIGSHNDTYADCVNNKFTNFEDFIEKWENGLYIRYQKALEYSPKMCGIFFLITLFQNEIIQKYIYTFLERNYYRNYTERIRQKPAKHLTELYIGDNNATYLILITPVFRKRYLFDEEHWENDVSEIRRCKFPYWTIPHLLEAGYIYNNHNYKTPTLADILNFYKGFYNRSNSPYEKKFLEKYAYYISEHFGENIPLLIPEFRYGGAQKKHLYRLDFLIINVCENRIIGIELSPNHHISEDSNTSVIEKWEYEIAKRNKFFETYEITTITYTSSMLRNIDDCWNKILPYLKPIDEFSISSSYDDLMNIRLDYSIN